MLFARVVQSVCSHQSGAIRCPQCWSPLSPAAPPPPHTPPHPHPPLSQSRQPIFTPCSASCGTAPPPLPPTTLISPICSQLRRLNFPRDFSAQTMTLRMTPLPVNVSFTRNGCYDTQGPIMLRNIAKAIPPVWPHYSQPCRSLGA